MNILLVKKLPVNRLDVRALEAETRAQALEKRLRELETERK